MTDTTTLGLPEAARRFGVSVRVLRDAMRAGKLPAPPRVTATTLLSAEWFDSAMAAVEASPNVLNRAYRQKIPPFARYEGTSAWRKYPNRVREYAHHCAATKATAPTE